MITTTKEEDSSYSPPSCCCYFCSSIAERGGGENTNNWWKRRRKMRNNVEIRLSSHKSPEEDEFNNDDDDPVSQDCNHPPESFKESTISITAVSKSNSNSGLNSRSMPICDYEPKLFSPKTRRSLFDIRGSGCGINHQISRMLSRSFVTFINFLVIFITLILLSISSSPTSVESFPTNDCDWSGSGTPENVVQAVYLKCAEGHILWERPKGGLRVSISPPKYFKVLGQRDVPFRLCLETSVGSNFEVFLEETSESDSGNEERRKLLPFIAPRKKSSTCYRISTPTATLYVESQSQHGDKEEDLTTPRTTSSSSKDAYQVKISYEIEAINIAQEGFSDDECRPCSDAEVLQLYCMADVVARGEILSVGPSSKRKGMDNVHIKSNLLMHQNHPVFQPLKSGNKNLQKFLQLETPTFDQDSPKKVSKPGKSSYFAGVVSHPSKCAAQTGPGEFLWLIKLSFGRPKIGCVLYWDKWAILAKKANLLGNALCPLVYQ